MPDPVSYERMFGVIEERGEYPAGGAKGMDIKHPLTRRSNDPKPR